MRHTTSLGCEIDIEDAPEHLGEGLIMSMTVRDRGHIRQTEVYLDRSSMIAVGNYLNFRAEEMSPRIARKEKK